MEDHVFPLTSLLDEELTIVFSYLDVKDRLQVCLVCKKWLKLINRRSLLSDITVNFKCSTFDDYSYPCMTRNFLNFDLIEISTDDNWKNGINYINPCVENLSFNTYESIRNIRLNHCKAFENLSELDVFSGSGWQVFPSCPNLLILSLYSYTITDAFIIILQKTMKHLKVLNLVGVTIVECIEYYPPGVTYEEYPSNDILSVSALKSFISERVSTLSEIGLNVNPLTVSTLKELLCMKGLNLTTLRLYTKESSPPDISKFLIDVFRHHQNLKTLNLLGFKLKNFKNLFCAFLPDIKELIIACEITDKCLSDIFDLKELQKLEVSTCAGISPSGCLEAIANFKPIQIKHLALEDFVLPKDASCFFKQLVHLVHLDLTRSLVTDSHVHIISTNLVNLKELILSHNEDISDYGLTAILDMESNQDNAFNNNISGCKALSNLKHLVRLDLSWCAQLTDDGIIAAVTFPVLRYLFLYGLNFTENTYSVLQSQNPYIHHIGRNWSYISICDSH